MFGISIFEILVGRNTPSIGETFGEICIPLRQTGYMPRPCQNIARKFGIFKFSQNVVTVVLSYINKIDFGPKITELWQKKACPYMGTQTIFDYNSALK